MGEEFSTKKIRNRLIISVGLFMLANLILHTLIHEGSVFSFDETDIVDKEFRNGLLITLFVGMPLVGFLFGLLVSFIPFRRLKYLKKLIPSALISTLILLTIYFVLGLAGQIVNLG